MKKMTSNSYRKQILTGGALVLAATASVFAQQKPFMQGGTAQPPAPPVAKPAAAAPEATKDVATSTNVEDDADRGAGSGQGRIAAARTGEHERHMRCEQDHDGDY